MKTVKLGCGFWLLWTILTLVGFGASLYWVEVGESPYLGAKAGLIGGLAIGTCQAIALRPLVPRFWVWIMINALVWVILGISDIGAIGWIAPRTGSLAVRLIYGLVYGSITGLFLGGCQWVGLRMEMRQQAPALFAWLVGNGVIWSVALAVGWLVGGWLRAFSNLFLGEVLGLVMTWAIVAGLSGWWLVWCINVKSGDQAALAISIDQNS
ncbi:hypothetical protein Pse7367_2716 [Thalassoporum mexicanum PCC 7367]|uniref:hypothetical protein n=1 Tax=Thalassoporum mexicanum TaxID=3457544 RepID=UPI00029F817C|nr:hypothetical protein [Pseudanabaena sp. PCC 7367]AFY70971.1 hypothetical protein Pse7367_2716 [Pseudanabaena sp. PCC 7367]